MEPEGFNFSSGKHIYANEGIIGINSSLRISEGYDGGIYEEGLTRAEKLELADYMINLWTSFREKHRVKE